MYSSNEKNFYENPSLWVAEGFGDVQQERAKTTVGWFPPDVKSGVISNLLSGYYAVGIDRARVSLQYVNISRCQADAANLPFSDSSFDIVLAAEVIEHIPHHVFPLVLSELQRVSRRHILISVPYKERMQNNRIDCPMCGCRFHASYHMRRFELEDLTHLFGNSSAFTLKRVEGYASRRSLPSVGLKRVIRSLRGRKASEAEFRNLICPQCGYSRTMDSDYKNSRLWKQFYQAASNVMTLIPERMRLSWWLALYSRVN